MTWIWLACVDGPERHEDPGQRYGPRDSPAETRDSDPEVDSGPPGDTDPPVDTGPPDPCPADMALVGDSCMDLYEAPNVAGGLPLVMYSFDEAEAWCAARDKTLCLDTVWEEACAGTAGADYPYGNVHQPGVCNDDEVWRTYSQSSLSAWPSAASATDVEDLEELLSRAAASSTTASTHVEELYQGEPGGQNAGCVNGYGVYDLVGNVEEWTRRADGGSTSFHGNLKGRYWAESRTCSSDVTVHGDSFRFYEIGFRCCKAAI